MVEILEAINASPGDLAQRNRRAQARERFSRPSKKYGVSRLRFQSEFGSS
jgi:hypothetical protein